MSHTLKYPQLGDLLLNDGAVASCKEKGQAVVKEAPEATASVGEYVFVMEGIIEMEMEKVVGCIREADLTPLAGDISLCWDIQQKDVQWPAYRKFEYVSKLPFPLGDRGFTCEAWMDGDDKTALILHSQTEKSKPALQTNVPHYQGDVCYSGYVFRPAPDGCTHLRRVICSKIDLPMPGFLVKTLLIMNFKQDYVWLNSGALDDTKMEHYLQHEGYNEVKRICKALRKRAKQ